MRSPTGPSGALANPRIEVLPEEAVFEVTAELVQAHPAAPQIQGSGIPIRTTIRGPVVYERVPTLDAATFLYYFFKSATRGWEP
jgi:hypothetical protein